MCSARHRCLLSAGVVLCRTEAEAHTMNVLVTRRIVLALVLLFGLTQAAHADLSEILSSGRIRIGVPVDLPPFGYLDDKQQPIGLDIDVAKLIADGLGVRLEMQQITGQNRIPFLLTNKLDLVVSALGVTPERARQIAFSQPYSSISIGVFGPAGLNVTGVDSLGTWRVAVVQGSTQDVELTRMAPTAKISRYNDDATAITAYLSGQADLLGTADVVALQIAKQNPERAPQPKFIFRLAPTHVGLRQGNPELLQWVNSFIFYYRVSGELSRLSQHWLGSPLPANLPGL